MERYIAQTHPKSKFSPACSGAKTKTHQEGYQSFLVVVWKLNLEIVQIQQQAR